jgi:chromosomal replication initiator protein
MSYCLPCDSHKLKPTIVRDNPEEILDLCCQFFNVTRKDLIGKAKYRTLIYPRYLSMYLLHSDRNLYLTLTAIGEMFGGRDHSTVIHAIRTINQEFEIYDDVYTKAVHLYRYVYGSIKFLELGKR